LATMERTWVRPALAEKTFLVCGDARRVSVFCSSRVRQGLQTNEYLGAE
jgi:hypothetical protein